MRAFMDVVAQLDVPADVLAKMVERRDQARDVRGVGAASPEAASALRHRQPAGAARRRTSTASSTGAATAARSAFAATAAGADRVDPDVLIAVLLQTANVVLELLQAAPARVADHAG